MYDILFTTGYCLMLIAAAFSLGYQLALGHKGPDVIMSLCCGFSGNLARPFFNSIRLSAYFLTIWVIHHYLNTPTYLILATVTHILAIPIAFLLNRNMDIEYADSNVFVKETTQIFSSFK